MGRRGLNNEMIIEAAIELVEEKGYQKFAMRELAARLDVQPASLYNHVSGIEEVNIAVGLHGIHILEEALTEASRDGTLEDKIFAMAKSYREFAGKSPELYQAVIGMRTSENEMLKNGIYRIVKPFLEVIKSAVEDEKTVIHLQRLIRSSLHGFVTLEQEGYLTYDSPDAEESFLYMTQGFVKLVEEERGGK